MITVYWMDVAVNLVTFLLAYLISVTLVGCFRAWVANVWGDDTPKRLGFLTLDMTYHTDPIGLACLLLFNVGWGRYIPVNQYNIHGRFALFKRCFVQYADSVGFLLLALIFQTAVIVLIPDRTHISIVRMMNAYLNGPGGYIGSEMATVCAQETTLFYSVGYFLQGFSLANAFLAALSCVVNTTAIIIGKLFDPLRSTLTDQLLALGISLALFFFGLPWVRYLVMLFLIMVSELIAALIQSIGV